jgi:hypothetical protein
MGWVSGWGLLQTTTNRAEAGQRTLADISVLIEHDLCFGAETKSGSKTDARRTIASKPLLTVSQAPSLAACLMGVFPFVKNVLKRRKPRSLSFRVAAERQKAEEFE